MPPDVNPRTVVGVHRGMNTLPSYPYAVACDDGLDFNPYEAATPEPAPERRLPNPGNLGVVALASPDVNGDREFVSRRPLNDAELAQAYAEHTARHGIV